MKLETHECDCCRRLYTPRRGQYKYSFGFLNEEGHLDRYVDFCPECFIKAADFMDKMLIKEEKI